MQKVTKSKVSSYTPKIACPNCFAEGEVEIIGKWTEKGTLPDTLFCMCIKCQVSFKIPAPIFTTDTEYLTDEIRQRIDLLEWDKKKFQISHECSRELEFSKRIIKATNE